MECAPAPPPASVPRPRPSTTGGLAFSYSVVRIAEPNCCVRYEVVETRQFRDREKAIHEAYIKAAREWKPGASTQQPQKPEVRIWRTVMGGPDAWDRANAVAEDCRKKERNKEAQPPPEPEKSPPEPPRKVPGPLVK
ncbi:MAG: hypothetical protein FJ291_25640 [Planctomycetes bacterium]|nr:hypothetical protein [Planctomycetota bacterium]